ncbi:MAG: PTS sugar transporter subunit IIA [Spirochaetales bacterium]|nr:PTS sugar transporter subunit IIA [Spirochaetales bacterium]
MYIIDYLKPSAIFLNMSTGRKKKREILYDILKRSAEGGIFPAERLDGIFHAVIAREDQTTTGIGNGIAIPHCKTENIEHGTIIAATFPSGIRYGAVDNKPVKILFLFIFPGSENQEYLQVLAKVARLLGDETVRNKLILSSTPDEFREIIAKNDIIPITKSKEGKYVFILALSDEKRLQEVISNLVEIGAQTSLIIDSETLEKKLTYDIPIFAGLTYYKGKSPYSKTFIGILNSIDQLNYLNQLLIKEDIDLSKPGAGFILTLEAKKIIGGIPGEMEI